MKYFEKNEFIKERWGGPPFKLRRGSWGPTFNGCCGLHYFVSAGFGSFWVFANFSTAKRFKCLFFTAMKIHIMARIGQEKKTLILVH